MTTVAPGILLISDPFLKDPNFMRSVVLLCEHRQEGSLGFVLNRLPGYSLADLVLNAEGISLPVYDGGPVQKDSLHFIHRCPNKITGGIELIDGIFWGGDFEEVLSMARKNELQQKDIRLFLGYSGWAEGQLDTELQDKSWITRNANASLVFNAEIQQTWTKALKDLGGEYTQMTNYPIDPQLN